MNSKASPRKKALHYPSFGEKLAQASEIGLSMEIEWTEADHVAVLELALEMGLTTYDASYLPCAHPRYLPGHVRRTA